MEVEHLKNIGQRLLSAVGMDGGAKVAADGAAGVAVGAAAATSLRSAVDSCMQHYAGQTSLATDQDIRIGNLCNQWLKVLTHGIKVPVSTYPPIQNLITAGLNLAFNVNLLDGALWNYTKLHMTRHEEDRFKLLKTVNTPIGLFKAFLRSALNEKSLERYLQSWIGHQLIFEFYEDWALVRDLEYAKTLPKIAAELSSIFFALSIDKAELNEMQCLNPSIPEPVIKLSEPIAKSSVNKKITRQIITFDNDNIQKKSDNNSEIKSDVILNRSTNYRDEYVSQVDVFKSEMHPSHSNKEISTISQNSKTELMKNKYSFDSQSHQSSDTSSIIEEEKKLSESDIEDILLEANISCLELQFPENENLDTDKGQSVSLSQQELNTYLKLKISQMEEDFKQKSNYMENVVHELKSENNKLKEQLKNYVSAVQELDRDDIQSDEVKLYETKLVQVAQMHGELMEFNDMLQRQLQSQIEPYGAHYPLPSVLGIPDTLVNIWIPSAYLVSKGSKSFHIYQIFLKVGVDDWNVYRRYSEFRKLYGDLKNSHPDISFFKFPPKKAIGKKESWVVEQRRCQLQGWLRHIIHSLPQLNQSRTKKDLTSFLPFFLNTGNYENTGALRPVLTA